GANSKAMYSVARPARTTNGNPSQAGRSRTSLAGKLSTALATGIRPPTASSRPTNAVAARITFRRTLIWPGRNFRFPSVAIRSRHQMVTCSRPNHLHAAHEVPSVRSWCYGLRAPMADQHLDAHREPLL